MRWPTLETTEWWCVNYRANRHELPDILPFRMHAGQERMLPTGTMLFICCGDMHVGDQVLSVGTEVLVSGDSVKVRASKDGPVYGMIFDRERTT